MIEGPLVRTTRAELRLSRPNLTSFESNFVWRGISYLITGDKDLFDLSDDLPILTPAQLATKLREIS